MPLVNRTFDQLIDFTRTSAATFVNSSGNIASTPQSRNLLTFTQEFDNTAWSKNSTYVVPNQDPALATLGAEMCVNGDFASATGWTVGAGWVVSGGQATATATSTSLYGGQMTTVAGRVYRVDFDLVSYTSGDLAIAIGANYSGAVVLSSPPTGRRTVYVVSGTATTRGVEFYGGTISATIDNVSVREVVGGGIAAPDGTFTADKLLETTFNGVHNCGQTATTLAAAYTFSCYIKAAERTFSFLYHTQSNAAISINLTTGATAVPSGFAAPAATSVTAVGNGWYRLSMTVAATAASNFFGIYTATSHNTISFAGSTTSGIYIWGAQLEQVPDASLTLGGEARSAGVIGLIGSATAATYNTSTGVGSATRVDGSNQSSVNWTGLNNSASYRIDIENTGANSISMRSGTATGSIPVTVLAGTRVTIFIQPTSGAITITSGSGTANFTVHSFREITGYTNTPTDYTRNFGGLFPPRFDYDPVTRAPRGLLIEEQRTNLLLRSEEFDNASWVKATATVTANATTSPDGTVDADKVIVNTGVALGTSTAAGIRQSVSKAASAITYTYTVYMKAAEFNSAFLWMSNAGTTASVRCTFNLAAGTASATTTTGSFTGASATITAVGNGWYRCTLIATSDTDTTVRCDIWPSDTVATTGDGTSGIFVYGAQLEAGAFATSYIPTVASQVTRSADVAAINAPNFASWYNSTAGTFVAEFDTTVLRVGSTTVYNVVSADAGTNANQIALYNYANFVGGRVNTASVGQADINGGGSPANNVTIKAGIAYASNDVAVTVNGATPGTDTSVTLPTVDRLSIGQVGSANLLNGHLRSLRYYPTRLTNAQLQALTA